MVDAQNIVNKVALKVGAIGIGNGGGQSGVELYKSGVDVILLNSSARDLASEVVPDGVKSYIIEDKNDQGRGAGRNREIAKKLFSDFLQSEKLLSSETFDRFVREKDVIFIIASTGGGTGSGIAPTLAYQISEKYPNKVIIVTGILPRLSESINSQNNCVQFFKELEQLKEMGINLPYALFDLEKYSDLAVDEAYTRVAKDITAMVKVVRGDYAVLTKYGMIDERNMLTMISTAGMLSVYAADNLKMGDIRDKGIQTVIKEYIKNTSNVDAQKDRISKYMGLFIEVDDDISDPVKNAQYDELFETIGEPFEIFTNYGITNEPTGRFGLIISGQSSPYDRFTQAIDRVNQFESNRREKEYSIEGAAQNFKDYAKNENIGKILGSSSEEPSEAPKELPSFLKPSI